MSVEVTLTDLFEQVASWGFCYLVTVSDDGRAHVIALRPVVAGDGDERALQLDVGAGRAGRNVGTRPDVTLVFPPRSDSEGMSLIVDGRATVSGGLLTMTPASSVMHRRAP